MAQPCSSNTDKQAKLSSVFCSWALTYTNLGSRICGSTWAFSSIYRLFCAVGDPNDMGNSINDALCRLLHEPMQLSFHFEDAIRGQAQYKDAIRCKAESLKLDHQIGSSIFGIERRRLIPFWERRGGTGWSAIMVLDGCQSTVQDVQCHCQYEKWRCNIVFSKLVAH